MQFGLDIAQHQLSWDEIRERAVLADEAGLDGAWVFDHFQPLYGDPMGPCLEGWSLLAALAAVTERVRLGVLVTGVTYRHPSILAAQAVTVDHVSAGRLELGLGAAWHAAEHRALGLDLPRAGERIARLDEAIGAMRLLMTTEEATFDGRYYALREATYRPPPVQRPHPPIWVGGQGERKLLAVAARQGDAWHGFGSPESWARKSRLLDDYAEQAGRDPAAIGRSSSLSLSQPWDDVRRDVEEYARTGCDYLVIGWPREGRGHLEEFVERVMPALAG